MLQMEFGLSDGAALTDRETGDAIATISVMAIIQKPHGTVIRLGIDAPQTVKINKTPGKMDSRVSDGQASQR